MLPEEVRRFGNIANAGKLRKVALQVRLTIFSQRVFSTLETRVEIIIYRVFCE